jgi:hypothetical protein
LANSPSIEVPELRPDPVSTVPFPQDPDFVGRDAIIDQMAQMASILGSQLALAGLGDVGVGYNNAGGALVASTLTDEQEDATRY